MGYEYYRQLSAVQARVIFDIAQGKPLSQKEGVSQHRTLYSLQTRGMIEMDKTQMRFVLTSKGIDYLHGQPTLINIISKLLPEYQLKD